MFKQIFQQNYFELFKLPAIYPLDREQLQQQLRELQKQFHPDNFTASDPLLASQSLAVSGHINQAYTVLSAGLSRAIYLLEQAGIKVDLVHDTHFPQQFLLAQIELREQIAEAAATADIDELLAIESGVVATIQDLEQQIGNCFAAGVSVEIVELIKQLAFYSKLEQLLNNILNGL